VNNFVQRILTGSVFTAVILLSIWFGPLSFQLLFLLVTILALNEFYQLTTHDGDEPNRIGGIIAGALTYSLLTFAASGEIPERYAVILLPILSLLFILELYRKKSSPFRNISLTLIGIIYTAIPFALLTSISHIGTYNRSILIGYFVLLWSNDSFAYVFGNLFGKTRLFERISPKKSWEGSIGGTISTLVVAYLFYLFNPETDLWKWIVMAGLICIFGTLGDLAESMLKRSLGVKDSGTILPGHGGILDRFDGLFLSVPFVWAFFIIFG
jgi:phosphatidate cytidylyltransferase